MTGFIIRRLLYSIPILLGTTFLLFLIFNVVPGDPALQIAGRHASAESLATIRSELGLDQPWYTQYFMMLKQYLQLDFGRSYAYKTKIIDMISDGAGASLSLLLPPFLISIFLSLGLGIFVAINRGRWNDRAAVAFSVGGQSISLLVYILAGQYFLAYKWGWFPISGYDTSWSGRWEYLVLPSIIYVVLSLAPQMRFYRTVILDELYQDYVRTARSKGLGTGPIMFRHVLKNALIPIITDVVISIPFLILGALLLESYFSIPGLGDIIVRAIANNDRPVLMSMTVFGTMAYIVFNVISDILYALADPRVEVR